MINSVDPRAVAVTVTDPELPMLTLADLGVLRDVRIEDGTVVVEITPTYTGCPAMGVMRADLVHALHAAGFDAVDVRTVLSPPWSTDWITAVGRRKLAEAGIAPPGPAPGRPGAAHPRPEPPHGGLPTVRLAGHGGDRRVRRDGVQGTAPLPQLPRAVRAPQGALSP